ncbi:MFS transporter [Mesorhizobium sp. Cs1299R1N3]|uniref:MFS transporter n=1 Tax=Mesorhizobium sp. Cs1299R1N3 TaxID=3015173 RepID=UPI003FA5F98C
MSRVVRETGLQLPRRHSRRWRTHLSCDLAWCAGVELGLADADHCDQLAHGDHLDLGYDGRACETSTTLPVFILSIFAGAIADNFGHRTCDGARLVCLIALSSTMLTALVGLGFCSAWMILSTSTKWTANPSRSTIR